MTWQLNDALARIGAGFVCHKHKLMAMSYVSQSFGSQPWLCHTLVTNRGVCHKKTPICHKAEVCACDKKSEDWRGLVHDLVAMSHCHTRFRGGSIGGKYSMCNIYPLVGHDAIFQPHRGLYK